jgi:thermostable 8-oxoguanine DNA glycosylase
VIDPSNITDYNLNDHGLQETLIFWICVAGKTASVIARALDKMLNNLEGESPFDKIKQIGIDDLPKVLKSYGIGCYNSKAKAIWELVNSDMDLRTCTTRDLETISGIGRKTSRCFIMHSRPDSDCAGLDVHILKFLREKGHNVPKSTPSSKKQYEEIEKLFLKYVRKSGKPVAEFDLDVWRRYAFNGGRV